MPGFICCVSVRLSKDKYDEFAPDELKKPEIFIRLVIMLQL
jgi:hypothetical protein